MPKTLTALSVEKIRPAAGRLEIPDGGCRGLYLIVQPSGHKSWAVRYRFGGKTRKLTLGTLTLAAARHAATSALREVIEHGRDPGARAAAPSQNADTIEQWADAFIERYAKQKTRPSSWKATESIFRRIVIPAWAGRSVHDIRRRDVIDLVEGVAVDRPVMANRSLAALSKFFKWLASRDVVVSSPCIGVSRPGTERARRRALSDGEIVRFWHACAALSEPFGDIFRLLLLLGARRQEVAEMCWSEIQGRIWLLPPERSKNRQERTIPLSAQAFDIISAQPRIVGSDYVFGRPRTGFNHFKTDLDAAMRPDSPWVTHDLRRTMAAGMQKLDIQGRVIEHVLGHRSGEFRGITAVYQVHEFNKEKGEALQRWADYVSSA
jgi:integrase